MKLIAVIRPSAAGSQTEFDRSAIEAALRIKAQAGTHVTAVCLGDENAEKLLREAAGMGCDSALRIQYVRNDPDGSTHSSQQNAYLEPSRCAAALAGALGTLEWDAVITSCYAVDADAVQTGFLLAELLSLPETGYAEEITLQENGAFLIRRQFEDSSQLLELQAPCLISALPKPGKRIYMTAEGITRAYAMDIPVIKVLEQPEHPQVLLLSSRQKKERRRGRVLTLSTEESVSAIMDTIIRNHIL